MAHPNTALVSMLVPTYFDRRGTSYWREKAKSEARWWLDQWVRQRIRADDALRDWRTACDAVTATEKEVQAEESAHEACKAEAGRRITLVSDQRDKWIRRYSRVHRGVCPRCEAKVKIQLRVKP